MGAKPAMGCTLLEFQDSVQEEQQEQVQVQEQEQCKCSLHAFL